MPRVSVVMTTYNEPRYLRQAIESVINQSYKDWELIIVNDATPHAQTSAIIHSFNDARIRSIEHKENRGNAKSANEGIRAGSGEYIARLDDDDMWVSREKLEKQIAFLDANPEHNLIGSNILVADYDTDIERYKTNYAVTDDAIRKTFFTASPFAHSSVLFRRNAAIEVGLYDEKLSRIEDYDLWLRLGSRGKMANSSECFVRWHAPSKTLKNVSQIRFNDQRIKLKVLWRYRKQYPHFWLPFLKETLKTIPYWILS